jgi:hypothetical protein
VSQHDRHLTTEELSAFLDGQLAPTEHAQWDEHLKTCEECQLKVADLRQTVALLHALPQPRLPRSFVLPTEAIVTPIAAHREQRTGLEASPKLRWIWPSYIQATVRTISTLAAMVGIVLVLAGLLTTVQLQHGATSASAPMAAPSVSNGDNAQNGNTSGGTANNQAKSASSATTTVQALTPMAAHASQPTSVPTSGDAESQQQYSSARESSAFLDLNTAEGRTGVGILLLALSIVGFVLLARQRRHVTEG